MMARKSVCARPPKRSGTVRDLPPTTTDALPVAAHKPRFRRRVSLQESRLAHTGTCSRGCRRCRKSCRFALRDRHRRVPPRLGWESFPRRWLEGSVPVGVGCSFAGSVLCPHGLMMNGCAPAVRVALHRSSVTVVTAPKPHCPTVHTVSNMDHRGNGSTAVLFTNSGQVVSGD